MKRKNKKIGTVILSVLALTVITLLGLMCYKQYLRIDELNNIEGEWVRELDLSGKASSEAYKFLNTANGISLSQDEISEAMKDVKVDVTLKFTKSGYHTGDWSESLSKEDYDMARDLAYDTLSSYMRNMIAQRAVAAGYTLSDEELDEKINEAFGSDLKEYFLTNGPVLLDDFDTLNVEINRSGTYEVFNGELIRYFNGVSYGTSFSKTQNSLIIDETTENGMRTYLYAFKG